MHLLSKQTLYLLQILISVLEYYNGSLDIILGLPYEGIWFHTNNQFSTIKQHLKAPILGLRTYWVNLSFKQEYRKENEEI